MASSYWKVRGNYAEKKKALSEMSKAELEELVLDDQYNRFLSDKSDFREKEDDLHGQGKRIPYIGWFWRGLDFSSGKLPIGDCGEMIGFMANNKWDYPERDLTEAEFVRVMEYIDKSIEEDQKGGELREIIARTNAPLNDLWEYMQTLKV